MNYQYHRNILLEEYHAIYYVLPKNACSAMKARIIDVLGMPVPEIPKEKISIHDPQLFPYPFAATDTLNSQYRNYLRFCFVRNPWDRLVSCFVNKIRTADFNDTDFEDGVAAELLRCSNKFRGGMAFGEFVDIVCSISDAEANNHFQSQIYLMSDTEGELLVNYIGKIEHLPFHLNMIHERTKFPVEGFPHANKSKRKPYQAYYDSDLVAKVEKRYASDAKIFNYSFDGVDHPGELGFVDADLQAKVTAPDHLAWILKEKLKELRKVMALGKGSTSALKKVILDLQYLEEMENSLSWKITAPMRKIAALLGKRR